MSTTLFDTNSTTPTSTSTGGGFVHQVFPAVDVGDSTSLRVSLDIASWTANPPMAGAIAEVQIETSENETGTTDGTGPGWRKVGPSMRATHNHPHVRAVIVGCDRYVRAVLDKSYQLTALACTLVADETLADRVTALEAL